MVLAFDETSASNRCSLEMNWSPRPRDSLSASSSTWLNSRDGAAAPPPSCRGRRSSASPTLRRRSSARTFTRPSSGPATPPSCSSRACSRWTSSTAGLPCPAARPIAVCSASPAFTVNRSNVIIYPSRVSFLNRAFQQKATHVPGNSCHIGSRASAPSRHSTATFCARSLTALGSVIRRSPPCRLARMLTRSKAVRSLKRR